MPDTTLLSAIVQATVSTLYEGGLWILLGFVVAGALHVLVDPTRLARHLGERSLGACVRAALLGAPIPLCSCGVLPAAMALRQKGASREATLSFLITTPETGVDSIAVTAAYFGPVMAVIRPLVAILSGVVAGALSLRLPADQAAPLDHAACRVHGAHGHAEQDRHDAQPAAPRGRLRRALRYATVDLFDDLGFWLAVALLLTGVLSALLPADLFDALGPANVATMALMVLLGTPMYVCASASTPLAALFVAKGASAGAALVFLLCGPATNAATIATVRRVLGPSLVSVYLAAIVGVAMSAGLLVDLLLPDLGSAVAVGGAGGPELLAPAKTLGMLAFVWFLGRSLLRTGLRPGLREIAGNVRAAARWLREARPSDVLGSAPVRTVAVVWAVAALAGGIVRVPPGQQGIRQRFGAVDGAASDPGLVYAMPFVDRVTLVRTDAVRVRPIHFVPRDGGLVRDAEPGAPLYVTADENLLDLRAVVQFRARDAVRFQLGVERPEDVLAAVVRAQLLQAAARHAIDRIYTSDRAEMETWIRERVAADAEVLGLGVSVVDVRLLDVHAPADVHEAFRDVASAHEDRQTTVHEATGYAAGVLAVARGEAEKRVTDATARATARRMRAAADAGRFRALAAAHGRAPALTETRMYLETAERVLPGARKVIRATQNGPRGYELWLRGSADVPVPVPPPPAAARRAVADTERDNL